MTNEELRDWLHQTARIITDVQICLSNADRLFQEKYDNENLIKKHGFFTHHYYQLWFILSIQLSKLLSESRNQHYNFQKLLKKLRCEELDSTLNSLLKTNKNISSSEVFKSKDQMIVAVDSLQEEIKKNVKLIKKIVTSRDTLYAHRDPNAKIQDINLDDAKRLTELVKRIYNCLNQGFYDNYFCFDRTGDWDIDFIIKQGALAQSQRLIEISKEQIKKK